MKRILAILMVIALVLANLSLNVQNVFAAQSTAPAKGNIIITNNITGKSDIIYIFGLEPGTLVKVYTSSDDKDILTYGTVSRSKSDITFKIPQLGTGEGSLYVSVIDKGKDESSKTKVDYKGEPTSQPIKDANAVTVTNNAQKSDTIYVSGLNPRDVIKVYSAETGGKLLGSKTVSTSGSDVTITVPQVGSGEGFVYVTVTTKGYLESERTKVSFKAEPPSDQLKADNIVINNNAKSADTIYIPGLSGGDVVKIYNDSGKVLATKTVGLTAYDATISVPQLGVDAGIVYITVTSKDLAESPSVPVDFEGELASEKPNSEFITVTNNSGKADTVYVTGLSPSDVVKVYTAATKGSQLGFGTVPASKNEVTISIPQLGSAKGSVFVSVTSAGRNESERVEATYSAERKTDNNFESYITVNNNVGKPDTVYVPGLTTGDTVKVYDSSTGGSLLGSTIVNGSNTNATVSISYLDVEGGTVYVSITNSGKLESTRVSIDYPAESKSTGLNMDSVVVSNNSGAQDTAYVSGLSEGTVVRVYSKASSGTQLGYATVGAGKTDTTVTIGQLGASGGTVWVSVTLPGSQESDRVEVAYDPEGSTNTPDVDKIIISNNVGKPDTVYLYDLKPGDTVRVYDAPVRGKVIQTGVVEGSSTDVTIGIPQLGIGRGNVYITVTSTGKAESSRISAEFKAESTHDDVIDSNVKVTNNAIIPDTIYISRLSAGDVVKVYDSSLGGTPLVTGTVASGSTDITLELNLNRGSGSVFVTVSSPDKTESTRKEVTYPAEDASSQLNVNQIEVTNNILGTPDTIFVTGLSPNDVIRAYTSDSQGALLGQATVQPSESSATITVNQLGTAGGAVYVSLTNSGKLEGPLQRAEYYKEEKTAAPDADKINVNNNSGANDTVRVTGLAAGDTVKVYSSAVGGTPIGSATVPAYSSEALITIQELNNTVRKIYVSVTGPNKAESDKIEKTYDPEPVSDKLSDKGITVINNAGSDDTVKVPGLTPGDIVKVYDKASGGSLLNSATVPALSTYAVVVIPQLGTAGGSIYISVTSVNKAEGERVSIEFDPEQQSQTPDPLRATVENNYGIASTVTVRGLKDNDVVSIYNTESGGIPIAQGTVAVYSSEVTIPVSQLNDNGGDIYITVTSTGRLESTRVTVHYEAKAASTAPNSSNVDISNNVVYSDIITLKGIEPGALVKVYRDDKAGNPIGSATMPSDGSDTIISIPQLGVGDGTVYVSVTTPGKTESARTPISYIKEEASQPLEKGNVTVINYSGRSDSIVVTGLQAYDTVNVYSSLTGNTKLATLTADPNTLTAVGNISLAASTTGGNVYVSVTNFGKSESERIAIDYAAESVAPKTTDITIENNAGTPDIITVEGLSQNDIVKIYDAAVNGNILISQKLNSSSNKLVVSIPQLTPTAGTVYVSVTNFGRAESSRTPAEYIAESSSMAPYLGDIYVANNVDVDDTVTVYNLLPDDIIKVYDSETSGRLLGYASVGRNKTEATVYIEDLGSSAGVVYVSVVTKGKTESARTDVSYVAEGRTSAPYSGYIYVTNNVTISDTILVTGLNAGDKVKVYDSAEGGELLVTATVPEGKTQVKTTIKQLGEEAGSVFVSVTSKGKTESKRTESEYVSEQTTNAPYSGFIEIANNPAGTSDIVTVYELLPGDIVNVYSAAADGSLLGTAQVDIAGNKAIVPIEQLGTGYGSVYVSVTTAGRTESDRTKADYDAE